MLARECGGETARDGIASIFRFVQNFSWHLPAFFRFSSLLKRFIKSIKTAQLQERLLL
ncbi:hypothetical protein ACXX83_08325 [Pseudomonas sp. GNP012]